MEKNVDEVITHLRDSPENWIPILITKCKGILLI
jgi:hypothetical protein